MVATGSTSPTEDGSDREPGGRDWRFLRSPFWLFSHLFALSVVSLFVVLGLWQLSRLGERQIRNEVIEARIAESVELGRAPTAVGTDLDDLDYRSVTATVSFSDGDFVRIANRSQGGAAGEHVVAVATLEDGTEIAVNRGFVPVNAEVDIEPVPTGPVEVQGWLRRTVTKGAFGAVDVGEGTVLPRFDVERVSTRLGRPLPGVWLQLAPVGGTGPGSFPDPIPLPPLDDGPHRSYAVQWFIFATLGAGFYLALLRRRARGEDRVATVDDLLDPG